MDFYDKGGILDEKLNLETSRRKKDLVAFRKALDGQPVRVTIPTDFPQ